MSDVEAVPSLPAALDHRPNALAVKVNHQSTSGPPSPTRTLFPPIPRGEDGSSKTSKEVDPAAGDGDGPLSPKADSEAETIIQSGRESLSPEKRRKFIKHEPKRRDDNRNDLVDAESELPLNDVQVRKSKSKDENNPGRCDRDTRPSSPRQRTGSPSIVKVEKPEEAQAIPNKIEPSIPTASRTSRKRSFSETANYDPEVHRPVRRHRSPVARNREERDLSNGISFPRPKSNERSVSPIRQIHRRTTSGGDHQRKRKAPTPLITGFQRQSSEDRQSVSSASGSPLPSAHVRKVASVDGASASPARPTGHKKQRDQNGRTRLARACAAQELEAVIARHAERPEDLNVADNAGNTPLQIASLEGCVPIVKFLIAAGCEVETCNIDKDTPLIDAAENGHLEVVKILLEAGANPRAINSHGDEPTDLVPDDCEEIRRVLEEAKANPRPSRRSEEHTGSGNRDSSSRRVSGASPRESPPINGQRSPPYSSITKRKSVRSEVTRNDLLWTKATPENLQAFAAKGDIAGVANILNVGQKADPESMIAAAKGGHDEVLSLLLGMGDADPDPEPVYGGSQKPGHNTPMLAAIGRGNIAVIKLLLDQPSFNPARRYYKDRTYFELSRERRADNWEEEYDLLREAYDKYIKTKKQRKSDISSPRRAREKEKENKRPGRKDSPSPAPRMRKPLGSPGPRDHSSKDMPKEKRRDGLAHSKDKASINASRQKPSLGSVSDPDASRAEQHRSKMSIKDGESGRGEEVHKRRRLIAGRPPDRDRKVPSLPSSDSLSGREESVKPRFDRSNEPAPKSAPPHLKRGRSSASPERPRSRGSEADRHRDAQKKKRRVLSEDGAPNLTNGGLKRSHPIATEDGKSSSRQKDDISPSRKKDDMKGLDNDLSSRRSERIKEEPSKQETHELNDIPMEEPRVGPETDDEVHLPKENPKPQRLPDYARANTDVDAKDILKAAKAMADREAAREREAKKIRQEQAAEEARIAAEAEKIRAEKEEEERVARAARIAQEKAEEERKRKEAEQRRIKQAEDERQKRLEQERQRLAKLRKEQEEQEQRRRDALPSRLRIAANLVGSNDPQARNHIWLRKFMPVVTAETKQLDPTCSAEMGEEKWIPNFLVAPLLATNDLQLSQYASWEKRDATPTQRMNLWRVTRRMLVQGDDLEFQTSSFGQVMQKDSETRPKYFDMEHIFWVKLSDFTDLVPHVPHLHGLDIRYLKMHIDREPIMPPAYELPQTNGHASGPPHIDESPGFYPGTGLTNGYGHSRPSTYV